MEKKLLLIQAKRILLVTALSFGAAWIVGIALVFIAIATGSSFYPIIPTILWPVFFWWIWKRRYGYHE